jgi:hypothetical protein
MLNRNILLMVLRLLSLTKGTTASGDVPGFPMEPRVPVSSKVVTGFTGFPSMDAPSYDMVMLDTRVGH